MSETKRDEPRIKHNLARVYEARDDYNHLAHRISNAKASLDRALSDLKAAGGEVEAAQAMGGFGL